VPKLIDRCCECDHYCVMGNGDVRCATMHRDIQGGDEYGFPSWCPRKDGVPLPEPYGESNLPKIGDMVRVDGLIGVVFNPSVGGRPNVWTIRKAEHLGLSLTDVSELTLLYRPEPTP